MTAQGQAGRRGDGWISVEERLPEEGSRCLLWGPSFDLVAFGKKMDPGWVIGAEWFADLGRMCPSHWMPLPAPPVADGQEGDDD